MREIGLARRLLILWRKYLLALPTPITPDILQQMKFKLNKGLAALILVTACSTATHAAAITGGIQIGALSTVNIDKVANTVSFSTSSPGVNAVVSSSQGSLSILTPSGTLGSYKDFTYDVLSVANPIWTFGTVTFDLTQITNINEAGSGLVLAGTGTLKATGYEDTVGAWSFSADTSGGVFSWSSTATAQVPDGGTSAALLGVSLLGLAGLSRKFRKL